VKNIITPKESLTEYRVLEHLKNSKYDRVDEYTLILVKLHTGRTHQIRVHFNSINHPLMGDILYGGKRSFLDGLDRQFLHAKKIEIRLPDETWIEAESELAGDLKNILQDLGSKIVSQL
jgi:23S rRNA pseudouridine1911/1915/1917 synthase